MLKRMLRTLTLILAVMSFTSLGSAAALHYGDRGTRVREVQEYLIAQCLLDAEADGVYGSSTVAAIKNFQEALGLEVDGVCGALTYKLLRAAAYDEIDVTTFKLGDYIPEHGEDTATDSVSEEVSDVQAVVAYAGVGDVIKPGMEGDGVVQLQTKLIELGYLDGEAHGVADATTISALKDFQRSQGINADGICGRKTYAALEGEADSSSFDDTSDMPRGRVVRVEATAYSSSEDGMGAYTATGTLCRRGVIATDPNFIPLGTRVYIPGYGYAVAEDTGGAIVGNVIDVAFDTVGECYAWGRQFIDIYILD